MIPQNNIWAPMLVDVLALARCFKKARKRCEAVMCSRAIHRSRWLDRIISQRRGSAYTRPRISDIHPRELEWHGEGTALCPEFHHATDDPMAP